MENPSLLLVDDEDHYREALARRFGRRGIPVVQAGNGAACLEILSRGTIEVVVLDVRMPGMSGLEVLKRIKEQHPEVEVILLTGNATTVDGVEGIKSGAFDYLTKPVEFEHLLGKIRQARNGIRRAREQKADAELRRQMEKQMIATERLASLGTLATGVAHEINNPLAIIKESAGWMRQLLQKQDLADMPRRNDFEGALEKIESSIERARRITHQLLGFVRRNDSAISRIDVGRLVDDATGLVQREAKNRNITLEKKAASDSPEVWSDPYQLRQVLLNLLTNALHATQAGGSVTVGIEKTADGCQITIEDTGEGISSENIEKIFEPFFSTKTQGEGTGLGLYVSRGIVEKLGGRIEVDSRLGIGSCFRIILPEFVKPK